MEQKLGGWKLKNLSLAGHVTLAGTVLSSISSYALQTYFLLATTTKAIDAKIRNIVWGDTHDKKKTHLIYLDVVCRSKSQGGLGLKKARELNEAYMMKLGWLILQAPEKLWVQVVTSKYLKKTDQGICLRRKAGDSTLWRGIRKAWPAMAAACQHSIRDGKSTLFWKHQWLDSGIKMADWATLPLDDAELERTVAEATTDQGYWDWDFLEERLSTNCLEQITGMDAQSITDSEDGMIWGRTQKASSLFPHPMRVWLLHTGIQRPTFGRVFGSGRVPIGSSTFCGLSRITDFSPTQNGRDII
ncbi:Putative ribonuclease H protein At1g65750 [Linum perenne]